LSRDNGTIEEAKGDHWQPASEGMGQELSV
jgi:hypothetical protein